MPYSVYVIELSRKVYMATNLRVKLLNSGSHKIILANGCVDVSCVLNALKITDNYVENHRFSIVICPL
jgi:hypothetical protein